MVQSLGLDKRAQVIVCGDTTAHAKPHPEPLIYAAKQLNLPAQNLIYVGDDARDIQAARAAMYGKAIAARYGYADLSTIDAWGADAQIDRLGELMALIET